MHLGAPSFEVSLLREKKIISFLESIQHDAQAVFLVGDVFDFWFEYKYAVPKGFVRFLAKLAELKSKGIDINIFTGNHDLWMNDYLQQEIGATIFHDKIELQCNFPLGIKCENCSKNILVAHGDGLGAGDTWYKKMKKVFTNKICIWLFRWLHPDIGIKIAQLWSRQSFTDPGIEVFKGEEREWLIQYCKKKLTEKNYNYFVMGHRHLPMKIDLTENSTYINLGDWIVNCNYAVFDGEKMKLIKYEN